MTPEEIKAAIDNQISLREHRNRALTEGTKGLFLINGGGAVALLAFLQAIWKDDYSVTLKHFVIVALWLFLLGSLAATLIGFMRYHSAFHKNTFTPTKNPWWWAQVAFTVASALLFLVGGFVASFGAWISILD